VQQTKFTLIQYTARYLFVDPPLPLIFIKIELQAHQLQYISDTWKFVYQVFLFSHPFIYVFASHSTSFCWQMAES